MSIILDDNELCNIIATANSRDYSEIEFIGHVSIAQARKVLQYLDQICKEHTNVYREYNQLPTRRVDCHECMTTIRKELGIEDKINTA